MGNRDENKREFVMLAGTYDPEKVDKPCRECKNYGIQDCRNVVGWYMSEKLDGMRCLWDGGISRGKPVTEVPYANWNEKDKHLIATGLWSRGGKVIHAPERWLDALPTLYMLDGELWAPGMKLQDIVSITRAYEKDEEWDKIKYWIFDSPQPREFLKAGRVHIRDWEAELPDMMWFNSTVVEYYAPGDETDTYTFEDFVTDWHSAEWLREGALEDLGDFSHEMWQFCKILPQIKCNSIEQLEAFLECVVKIGGEGIMLRRPDSEWHPRRARHDLIKYKKFYDAEAEVIGYKSGEITKKDSRLRGMLGALIVRELTTGHVFELAGFNDTERYLAPVEPGDKRCAGGYAYDHPGEEMPDWAQSDMFPRGTIVTFKYWDRTKDGIPKFAQFWRERTYE